MLSLLSSRLSERIIHAIIIPVILCSQQLSPSSENSNMTIRFFEA